MERRKLTAEAVGTAFLLMAIVGSGILAIRPNPNDIALAVLVNAIVTGGALVALINAFGPVSGCHINPAVTLSSYLLGGISGRLALGYVAAQVLGALAGTALAHIMFSLPLFELGQTARSGAGVFTAEFIATLGLIGVILGALRGGSPHVSFSVGAYILAAIFFTSSTAFANPAVTIARALTDTLTGIRWQDALIFVPVELLAAFAATYLFRFLYPGLPEEAGEVILPHPVEEEDSAQLPALAAPAKVPAGRT